MRLSPFFVTPSIGLFILQNTDGVVKVISVWALKSENCSSREDGFLVLTGPIIGGWRKTATAPACKVAYFSKNLLIF
jgi:hypothetical protein